MMCRENKDTYIKVRTTRTLKEKFLKKLEEDGISQSDFFTSCIMNYLDIKTVNRSKKIGERIKL